MNKFECESALFIAIVFDLEDWEKVFGKTVSFWKGRYNLIKNNLL